MTIQALLKTGASPSDALRDRISETTREVTRLKGEVVFVNEADLSEKEKKIIDKRKWE